MRLGLAVIFLLAISGCVSTSDQPHIKTSIWNEVKMGMSQEAVHKLLGKPTETSVDGSKEGWRQGPGDSAWYFVVTFDSNKKVSDYRSMYYTNSVPTR